MPNPDGGHKVTFAFWLVAASGVTVAGCGSSADPLPQPTGTIALALGPASATATQGATTQFLATVTRGGGYSGGVTISVESPNGITGAVSDPVTSGGTTTATITVSVGAGVSPGNHGLTVRARGAGVTDATAGFSLSVMAAPSFALSVTPVGLVIGQGAIDSVQVGIERTNFTGAVVLSVEGAPTGVAWLFAPAETGGTSSTLTITVVPTVMPAAYNLVVRGTGASLDRSAPLTVTVSGGPGRVAAATNHALAIKPDGSLWGWGLNHLGQLGDGTLVNRPSPTPIGNGATWRAVTAGRAHALAVKSDGSLWAWGSNGSGQLGDGTTEMRSVPVPVGAPTTTWRAIAAGEEHSLAIRSDGTLWAWGNNLSGRLGDGTETQQVRPTQIGTGGNWLAVAAGASHSVALKSDGTLWSWGNNHNGQLGGGGALAGRKSPEQIGTESSWAAIAVGNFYTMALRADGTLWAWGHNGLGQLGDGTATGPTNQSRFTPIQVGIATTWRRIAAGENHGMALQSDGSLWIWGHNLGGQVGDGTDMNIRPSPVRIGSATSWSALAGGAFHTVGFQVDGTFWTWGFNGFGQLGDGTTTTRLSPTAIAF